MAADKRLVAVWGVWLFALSLGSSLVSSGVIALIVNISY